MALQACSVLLFIGFSAPVRAQEDDYFDTTYKEQQLKILIEDIKEGVFKTFEEFKNNEPKSDCTIVFYRKGEKSGLFTNANHELYIKEEEKERFYKERFWGYSDGALLYINYRNQLSEFFVFGKYSLFKHTETTMSPGYMGANGVMSPSTMTTTTATYILELATGEITFLSKKYLRSKMQNHSELLKQFNGERAKNKKLVEYTILLNKY